VNIQNIIGNNLLLFTVNVWIKKPGGYYTKYFSRNNKSSHILERSLDYNWGHFNFWLHGLRAVKIWIKHRFQDICIGSPWYFVNIFKVWSTLAKGFFFLDFEHEFVHRSKLTLEKLMGLENINIIAIIRQTKHQEVYLR
jgi:hypothetical protein